VNEHVFCFDKFMEGTVLQESKVQVQEDDEPMRRRAARHQELPQNRIRMVHSA
jgi:Zn finger protein HypA/HybF involved in hydrogenase expression